jgi:3-hydroxybutyryl-CoA dehydratase
MICRRLIMKEDRPAGNYFEEWNLGDILETNGHTITKADIVNFAALSGDYNPMHTNVLHAKKTVFGERIAHGYLIVALTSGLINQSRLFERTTEAFLGASDLKFSKAVMVGDTIRCIVTITEKKLTSKGGGFITLQTDVFNQRDELCSTRKTSFLIKRRPA